MHASSSTHKAVKSISKLHGGCQRSSARAQLAAHFQNQTTPAARAQLAPHSTLPQETTLPVRAQPAPQKRVAQPAARRLSNIKCARPARGTLPKPNHTRCARPARATLYAATRNHSPCARAARAAETRRAARRTAAVKHQVCAPMGALLAIARRHRNVNGYYHAEQSPDTWRAGFKEGCGCSIQLQRSSRLVAHRGGATHCHASSHTLHYNIRCINSTNEPFIFETYTTMQMSL